MKSKNSTNKYRSSLIPKFCITIPLFCTKLFYISRFVYENKVNTELCWVLLIEIRWIMKRLKIKIANLFCTSLVYVVAYGTRYFCRRVS